ncbi:E3 ubiquitin-protein ligase TRIM33-like [Engraulis encrasicolus]|uniref:E3 ubiquitin-protein ligase TRIM33-like n=1 Tax=Engraulis encrasicolus TaxID=184585 RepID=UPI002FCF097C
MVSPLNFGDDSEAKRMKPAQGCSPTPSQDSLKTNQSMDLPLRFRDGIEAKRLKFGKSCSPSPSQDSLKTHRSMDLPVRFRDGIKAKRMKPAQGCSPTPSQDSWKTNQSMVSPLRFRDDSEAKSPNLKESSSSEGSQISEGTDDSMELSQDITGETGISTSGLFTKLLKEDLFKCLICEEELKDPVCIPCGHSFCRECIDSAWEQPNQEGVFACPLLQAWQQSNQERVFSCPPCQATYRTKPLYYINGFVVEVIKNANSSAGLGDIVCDFCTGKKLKAVKSCLTCIASFCEFHNRTHSVLQGHSLVGATGELERWLCPHHRLVLNVFCQTDQVHVCKRCALLEHNGHDIKVLSSNEPLVLAQTPEGSVTTAFAFGSPKAVCPLQDMKTPPSGLPSGPPQHATYDPSTPVKTRGDDFHSPSKAKTARKLMFD